jgi:mitogen-activated protein kinase kinase
MLLQHGWLASMSKPAAIVEEDEDEDVEVVVQKSGTEDEEVAAWVKNALERKKNGLLASSAKPALHTAPLDSISPATSPG